MTEVEFTRLLADLTQTAKALNKESDSLNDVIARSNEMLERLNIGLEVWLNNNAIQSQTWTEEAPNGEDVDLGTDDLELGFAEVLGEWCLALRGARYKFNNYSGYALHSVRYIKRVI